MKEIAQVKSIVAGLELEAGESSALLKPWIKGFLEAPSSVLTLPEHRIVLREVARDWVKTLENEEIEVAYKDMDTLFESEEAQKQKFQAIMAAKVNKFANQLWDFKKDLKQEVEEKKESLANAEKSLALLIETQSSKTSKVKIPAEQEAFVKAIERTSEKLSDSLEEYENWLETSKQFPNHIISCLDFFSSQKLEQIKENKILLNHICWQELGDESQIESQSSDLRDEIEIQYYESKGDILLLEVLWRKKDKFAKQGKEVIKRGTQQDHVEPTHHKIKRADIGFIQYQSSGFQFSLVFLDSSRKTLVEIGKKDHSHLSSISIAGKELVGIKVKRKEENSFDTESIFVGTCDKVV